MDLLELRRLHAAAADQAYLANQHRDSAIEAQDEETQDMYNMLYEHSISKYDNIRNEIELIHAENLVPCSGITG